jgi:outer membrane protein OmpA-like peptidoglycan-associated protein
MTFKKLPMIFAATSLIAVTACSGTGGPNDNLQTRNGAAIGAIGGAILGAATADSRSERGQRAAVGALLGATAGGGIGSVLDRQEEELRQSLGSNVGITNNGQSLTVTLPNNVLFATDSASVSGTSQNDLFAVARSLNNNPSSTINVIGHTDNVGDASYNFDLSQRRAQAVTSVLVNAGVTPSRIRSIGRGEDVPVASNLDANGRAQNRRVEIVITPN